MSDYVVVTSTSNTVTVVNQPSTLVIGDSAMRGAIGATGATGPTGPQGPSGALTPWTVVTANTTAVNGDRLIANTDGGAFTITLPASPVNGNYIVLTDGGDWSANNLTVNPNGSTFDGGYTELLVDVKDITVELIYSQGNWKVTATIGQAGVAGPQGPTGPAGGPQGPQGPQGVTGPQGPTGATGATGVTGGLYFYVFNDGKTSNTDPNANTWHCDSPSDQANISKMWFANHDVAGSNIGNVVSVLFNANNTPRGILSARGQEPTFERLVVQVDNVTAYTNYYELDVTVLSNSPGNIDNNDNTGFNVGLIGNAGAQGPQGAAGNTGPQGPQGPQGVAGSTGPQGPQGPAGSNGSTGPQGPQGPQGNSITGPQGPQGPSGPSGVSGAGLPLANGTSNVDIPVANGYVTVTANTFTWTFNETNGLLELAGNLANFSACSAINFVANSSGDGAGYSTIELRPDSNATLDQYLIIDPTQPNHIHIRAGGQQDNSNAEIYLGGETSHFKVNNGENPSTSIASNGYVWTFNTDGTITFPDSTTQNTAYTGSGGGVGNVLVTANTGSQVNSGNINFINTSTVTVSVVSGDNGNANVSFTSVGGGSTIAAPNTTVVVANLTGAGVGTNNFVFNVATNRLGVGTNTPNSNIAVVGNVWVTTGINTATINVTTANITNVNGSSSLAIGTGVASNGNVIIHANGVEILRATNARRIGINTTTPNSNVSIVGNVWVTTGINAATINVTTANATNVVTTNAIIGVANISGNLNVTGTISVTGATYGDLTGGNNITSNTFTANANVQQLQYTLSTVPGNIAISEGSTVNINNFSGMVIINNWTSGGIQMWLVGGGAVGNVGNTLDLTISNTGSITHSSPNYVWTAANTATYSFATVKTRDNG